MTSIKATHNIPNMIPTKKAPMPSMPKEITVRTVRKQIRAKVTVPNKNLSMVCYSGVGPSMAL